MVGYMTYLPCCISAVGWDYLQMVERCEVLEKMRSIDGDAAGASQSGMLNPPPPQLDIYEQGHIVALASSQRRRAAIVVKLLCSTLFDLVEHCSMFNETSGR